MRRRVFRLYLVFLGAIFTARKREIEGQGVKRMTTASACYREREINVSERNEDADRRAESTECFPGFD